MGYTHYFAYDPNVASFLDAWPRMVSDAQLIAIHVRLTLRVRLADGVGEGEPEITERRISLNGPVEGGLAHETFTIDPTPWRTWDEQAALGHADWADYERGLFESRGFIAAFCKTARRPYDIAVSSILLRCRHLAPDAFVIASDGDWEGDWHPDARASGSAKATSPIGVVGHLFAQVEDRHHSPCSPTVWDGPVSAGRRHRSSIGDASSAAT